MVTQKQISDFLAHDVIAAVGVSRNPKKFGYTVFKELRQKGLNLIPVHPQTDEIDGVKTVPSVMDLPEEVQALYITTGKNNTLEVVRQAREKGIPHIWIQQTSDTPEALAVFEGTEVNLIHKECILMHHQPHSIHKFHRRIKGFFGRLPK